MSERTTEPVTSERFDRALVWASELHRLQVRKETDIPYVSHLLAVSSLVLEHGGNEDQAIAALLHDALEDADTTLGQIGDRFGPEVARLVAACTDDLDPEEGAAPGGRGPGTWMPRKQHYLAHLAHGDADALLVTLADKVHNARSVAADVERVGETYLEKFNGKATGTRWYYRRVYEALAARADELPLATDGDSGRPGNPGAGPLLADLARSLDRFGATPEAAAAFDADPTPR